MTGSRGALEGSSLLNGTKGRNGPAQVKGLGVGAGLEFGGAFDRVVASSVLV